MPTTFAKPLIAHRGKVDPWGRSRESVAEHAQLAAKLNEEARENWDNDSWHRQVAADLATTLDYGFTFENLFSTYIQTQNVGEFDRIIVRERRGLEVFYTAKGGYIDETQMRTEEFELPRDTLGFHVSEFIDKLRANFAESIEAMATLGEQRMDAEVNRRILQLLQNAVPVGSPYYVDAPAGLDQAVLNEALRDVKDAIRPDGFGPVPVTIVGRASAVDQIADFPGYGDEALEELRLRGRIGTYRGANIVTLQNYTDEDGVSYVPANELWVFGGTVGQFALYGPMIVKSWEENTVDYRHYRARKDLGGLVYRPEQARRVVLGNVAP